MYTRGFMLLTGGDSLPEIISGTR